MKLNQQIIELTKDINSQKGVKVADITGLKDPLKSKILAVFSIKEFTKYPTTANLKRLKDFINSLDTAPVESLKKDMLVTVVQAIGRVTALRSSLKGLGLSNVSIRNEKLSGIPLMEVFNDLSQKYLIGYEGEQRRDLINAVTDFIRQPGEMNLLFNMTDGSYLFEDLTDSAGENFTLAKFETLDLNFPEMSETLEKLKTGYHELIFNNELTLNFITIKRVCEFYNEPKTLALFKVLKALE